MEPGSDVQASLGREGWQGWAAQDSCGDPSPENRLASAAVSMLPACSAAERWWHGARVSHLLIQSSPIRVRTHAGAPPPRSQPGDQPETWDDAAIPPGLVPLPWCQSDGLGGPGDSRAKKTAPWEGRCRIGTAGMGSDLDGLSPGLRRQPDRNDQRLRSRSCRRPTAGPAPWAPPGCSWRSGAGRRRRGCASARTHRCCACWGAHRRCCIRRHRRWDP